MIWLPVHVTWFLLICYHFFRTYVRSFSAQTITLRLYLPKSAFVESTRGRRHDSGWERFVQPAVISLWSGITFKAGELCGSLKIGCSNPKVNCDHSSINVPSKLLTMNIDSAMLKKSAQKLKRGLNQITREKENAALEEGTHSLVPSSKKRFLFHAGMYNTDTSLKGSLMRYFKENFPRMIHSQRTEVMLSIHHGHQISNHKSRYHQNGCILDALVGVNDAISVQSGFYEDACAAVSYKDNNVSSLKIGRAHV